MKMKSNSQFSMNTIAWSFIALLAVFGVTPSFAGEGHDHGEAKSEAGQSAAPRFYAISDDFELTGIVSEKAITLFLDNTDTNEPVKKAKIDLEIDGQKMPVTVNDKGEYEVLLSKPLSADQHTISATVSAGDKVDLLAGDLDLHSPNDKSPEPAKGFMAKLDMKQLGIGATVLLFVLGAIAMLKRRRSRSKSIMACLVAVELFTSDGTALAGEGHDHGDSAPVATSNSPKRQPDGSVFLPKPAQYQIGVRTMTVEVKPLAKTYELTGKVISDPNAGGKVQPTLAGRIEAGPKGLPSIGQRVSKGEILAHVVPSSGAIERSNQTAAIAELRAAKSLAEKKLARLKELSDTVPRREIDAVESELISINGRMSAMSAGLSNRDVLVAPVSGLISDAKVVLGQVVEAKELLFEIVDPTRLKIEALAFDNNISKDIASATVAIGNNKLALKYVGASSALREQAQPLLFRVDQTAQGRSGGGVGPTLTIGQPVRVLIQSANTSNAIAVPSVSLMKNPSNQSVVWVKTGPEKFIPQVITFENLDGERVAVTSGLKGGERVVNRAATLINQIR
jgi:membrane fusion protein, heavy metal efflux system